MIEIVMVFEGILENGCDLSLQRAQKTPFLQSQQADLGPDLRSENELPHPPVLDQTNTEARETEVFHGIHIFPLLLLKETQAHQRGKNGIQGEEGDREAQLSEGDSMTQADAAVGETDREARVWIEAQLQSTGDL
ncbi:hypothetical protein ACJ73_03437 [Blastomyces percursus]|uniref:Uncharacterized protein n=1 Tax=Blastomyces percursus TaxID=1658174 RepID=A0A1J9R9I7_9EURO|nr:hypothetical protein ACJ73_03437 [Blastomyces percursus]